MTYEIVQTDSFTHSSWVFVFFFFFGEFRPSPPSPCMVVVTASWMVAVINGLAHLELVKAQARGDICDDDDDKLERKKCLIRLSFDTLYPCNCGIIVVIFLLQFPAENIYIHV